MFYPPETNYLTRMQPYNIKNPDRLVNSEPYITRQASTRLPSFTELLTSIPISGNEKPNNNIVTIAAIPGKPYIHRPFAQRPITRPASIPNTPDRLSPYLHSISQSPIIPIVPTASITPNPVMNLGITLAPPSVSGTISPLSTGSTTPEQTTVSPRTNKRRHICKTCSKSFTTSGHLARHNRIHTGERKHVCPWATCGARFARQDNCMQHYKIHINGKNRKNKNTTKFT